VRKAGATAILPDGGETILVVEDNPMLGRLVVLQLTTLGYQAREAQNGAAAVEILERGEPIDLLFADVVMPGQLDGYDLAGVVQERWPSIKVVVLASGFAGTNHNRDISDIPLLTKPYRREDIAQLLRGVLDDRNVLSLEAHSI
jgi:CheY-like chemotaxis protein